MGRSGGWERRGSRWVAAVLAMCIVGSQGAAGQTPGGSPAPGSPVPERPALAIPDDSTLAAAAASALEERPSLPEELPSFEAVRDEARSILEAIPDRDRTIASLAGELDYDPERAFAFVRDSIGVDPYPGVLRGAKGTLDAGAGSPTDRALLLAALLDAMRVDYRFARATLDDPMAEAIVARAADAPTTPRPGPGLAVTPVFVTDAIMARAARDYAQLRLGLGSEMPLGIGDGRADAVEAVRHHVWLQRRLGAQWQDLDPTMPAATLGQAMAPAAETSDALPDELVHRVRIRLEEERLTDGTLTTSQLLEYLAPAWDAADSELFLLFAPLSDRLGGTISELLTGDVQWYPSLMVDGVRQQGRPFRVSSTGTDLFGSPEDPGSPLTAVRLIVDTLSPDGTDRHVERLLLDRVPPAVRASGQVSEDALDPMTEDDGIPRFVLSVRHVMVSTGGADVGSYARQRYLATDYAGSTLLGATMADPPSPYDLLWPIAATDQALVVASETAVVPSIVDGSGARGFVASPRVFLTSAGRDPLLPDALAFVTDLAIDGVSVLPGADATSPARLQLWYGALQTALESQLALARAALVDPDGRTVLGASLGATGDLRVVDPADAPVGASPALRADLASGSVVLRWGGDDTPHAWWVVDRRDGATRSMVDPGLGGAVQAGRPAVWSRTFDTSYGHGKGPRLPPRPPMQPQAPGGPRGGCTGGNEDTAIMCHVSLPGGIALSFSVGSAVAVITEAAVFALLAWWVATK